MENLTINLHVTEACNFSCSFCFAHWDKKNEIFRDKERLLVFVEYLNEQAKTALGVEKLTINFAGGEPSLLRHLHYGVQRCRELGIRTSVISNGLIFRRYSLSELGELFDIVGISIDSFDTASNQRIGRVDSRGFGFDYCSILSDLAALKRDYGTFTKVNTVVSNDNFEEDLSRRIIEAGIDRWKIFRLLPVGTDQEVSQERFENFVARNSKHCDPVIEDNNDMMSAYVMVNSNGYLYQSDRVDGGVRYRYFDLNKGGLFEGLRHVGIDFGKYRRRYSSANSFDEFERHRRAVS